MRQARTPDQALADTLALLPDGFASTHSPDDYLGARFRPFGTELSALETSAVALLPEAIDPRAAANLLTDWEAEMATAAYLGDPASYSPATRAAVAFLLLTNGALVTAGDYIRFAALLGETITITQTPPSICGRTRCGDRLNPRPGHMWIFVVLPSVTLTLAQCGVARCGASTGYAEASVMQAIIAANVPLGFVPFFSYTG